MNLLKKYFFLIREKHVFGGGWVRTLIILLSVPVAL